MFESYEFDVLIIGLGTVGASPVAVHYTLDYPETALTGRDTFLTSSPPSP